MARLPRGVLPVADSFCRFNPIHGQGMSSAGKQALLLQEVAASVAAEADPVDALQAGFMARVAAVLEGAVTAGQLDAVTAAAAGDRS